MGAAKGIDWDREPLGFEPDASIARRKGCSETAVALQRRKRGILRGGERSVTLLPREAAALLQLARMALRLKDAGVIARSSALADALAKLGGGQ